MKRAIIVSGILAVMLLAASPSAEAGSRFFFGFGIGSGPAYYAPYAYYPGYPSYGPHPRVYAYRAPVVSYYYSPTPVVSFYNAPRVRYRVHRGPVAPYRHRGRVRSNYLPRRYNRR